MKYQIDRWRLEIAGGHACTLSMLIGSLPEGAKGLLVSIPQKFDPNNNESKS